MGRNKFKLLLLFIGLVAIAGTTLFSCKDNDNNTGQQQNNDYPLVLTMINNNKICIQQDANTIEGNYIYQNQSVQFEYTMITDAVMPEWSEDVVSLMSKSLYNCIITNDTLKLSNSDICLVFVEKSKCNFNIDSLYSNISPLCIVEQEEEPNYLQGKSWVFVRKNN